MRFLVTSRQSVTMTEFCPVAVVPAYSVVGTKLAATTYHVSLRGCVVNCARADLRLSGPTAKKRRDSPEVEEAIQIMNRALLDYFRRPEHFADVGVRGALSEDSGFSGSITARSVSVNPLAARPPSRSPLPCQASLNRSNLEGNGYACHLISSRSSRTCVRNDTTYIPSTSSNETIDKEHLEQSII